MLYRAYFLERMMTFHIKKICSYKKKKVVQIMQWKKDF